MGSRRSLTRRVQTVLVLWRRNESAQIFVIKPRLERCNTYFEYLGLMLSFGGEDRAYTLPRSPLGQRQECAVIKLRRIGRQHCESKAGRCRVEQQRRTTCMRAAHGKTRRSLTTSPQRAQRALPQRPLETRRDPDQHAQDDLHPGRLYTHRRCQHLVDATCN